MPENSKKLEIVKEVWFVPDTHMDFGWMAPNSLVRRRNYVVMDEARRILHDKPEHRFNIEATWMIDAYKDLAGEDEYADLLDLITKNRIAVSEHYAILDDRLAGEEARIFNSIIGRRTAERHGVKVVKIYYAKDVFGFDSQTPQVETKLGHKMIFRTRGDVPEIKDNIFHSWTSPDGKSSILDVRQIVGYAGGMTFGHDGTDASSSKYLVPILSEDEDERRQNARRRLINYEKQFADEHNNSDFYTALLFNGGDYDRIQRDLPEVVEDLKKDFQGTEFRIATVKDVVEHIEEKVEDPPEFCGDLFSEGAEGLRDVDTARIPYIKVPYSRSLRSLVQAESLYAFARFTGAPIEDAKRYLGEAWKELLAVGTHDFLSGSVTDFAMPEIEGFLRSAKEKSHRIAFESLGRMATGRELRYNDIPITDTEYSLLNLSNHKRRVPVWLKLPDQLKDEKAINVMDGKGNTMDSEIVDNLEGRHVVVVAETDGFSASSLKFSKDGRSNKRKSAELISNEYFEIRPATGGLEVVSKEDGGTWSLSFDMLRDRGDTYVCDVINSGFWESKDVSNIGYQGTSGKVMSEIVAEIRAKVPRQIEGWKLSKDKASFTIRLAARLYKGLNRVYIGVKFENHEVKDYVFRFLAEGVADGEVPVRDNFIVNKGNKREENGDLWQRGSYYDFDREGIAAGDIFLSGEGLFSHRVEKTKKGLRLIKVLQRGVAYVSREDTKKRPGHAASLRATPLAQCLGAHEYNLMISKVDKPSPNQIVALSREFLEGLVTAMSGVSLKDVPKAEGNAHIIGVKSAEDSDDLIYHIVNYGEKGTMIKFSEPAVKSNLIEEPVEELRDGQLELGPYEVWAVRIPKS